MVAPITIDSNIAGLTICKETSPKVLPGTPIRYEMEPNSYSGFGATIAAVARDPLSGTRQNKKGTITDVDSAFGFTSDFTQNNMNEQLQGFMKAEAIEKYSTHPLNGTTNLLTSVAVAGVFNATTTFASLIRVGDLVKTSGFTNAVNDGLGYVAVVTVGQIDTDISTVVEASPPADAKIQVVGFQYASGDLVATVSGERLILTSTIKDNTQLGLNVGDWIFIGGGTTASAYSFANGTGYARVLSVTATVITCDKSTGLVTADAGAAKTIRLFFGTYFRNAIDSADVVDQTYQAELSLGDDGDGIQSETCIGVYPNDFTLKCPTAAKLEVDLAYVAMDTTYLRGVDGLASGTRVPALSEEAFNTSSDVYEYAMNLAGADLTPTEQFAYVTEFNLSIKNGVKLNKAVGVVGGISATKGNFVVGGSVTAYFSTLAAIQAIRDNTDVTVHAIFAKSNAGWVFDIPLITLSGGNPNIARNEPIKLPLEQFAAENDAGYTLGIVNFHYLPDIAMPVVA